MPVARTRAQNTSWK